MTRLETLQAARQLLCGLIEGNPTDFARDARMLEVIQSIEDEIEVEENATLPGKKILRRLAAQGEADEKAEATQKHEPYGEEFIKDLFDEELE